REAQRLVGDDWVIDREGGDEAGERAEAVADEEGIGASVSAECRVDDEIGRVRAGDMSAVGKWQAIFEPDKIERAAAGVHMEGGDSASIIGSAGGLREEGGWPTAGVNRPTRAIIEAAQKKAARAEGRVNGEREAAELPAASDAGGITEARPGATGEQVE